MPLGTVPSIDIQVKLYGDRLRVTPPSGELNTRGVAEYSDFGPIEGSRKRFKKARLITNKKTHMSFRLVPHSLTLSDLERRNSSRVCVISSNWGSFWGELRKSG